MTTDKDTHQPQRSGFAPDGQQRQAAPAAEGVTTCLPQLQPLVVQKYGGSSVADFDRLKLVATRVVETVRRGFRVVVVVSAMGRTTDEMMRLARLASNNPSRRELDMLLSAGERIASALLAMAVTDLGQPAISFTGSQCGIITSHRHTNARILEVRPYRVLDELDEGRVVIIAGYQGVSYKREVTTLGRGGSDTTAVAIAAALGAEHCEICSDVDGVYSADPNQVDAPRHLERISYDEMSELSRFGAKVLNEEAVAFARRSGIVIYARASAGSERLTRVGGEPSEHAVVGITGRRDLVWLRGDGGGGQLGAISRLLDETQTPPLWARLDDGHPSVLLARELCHDYPRLRERLEALDRTIRIEERLEAATVVGEGLGDDPARLARFIAVIEREALPVRGVDADARRYTVLLKAGHVERAQQALHAEFIG